MSSKTSSLQGICSPAYSQACSFSTNKASTLFESTQHSCQDHKYNEVRRVDNSPVPKKKKKKKSITKCQAKQAADKTVVHHQYAKLASFQ